MRERLVMLVELIRGLSASLVAAGIALTTPSGLPPGAAERGPAKTVDASIPTTAAA